MLHAQLFVIRACVPQAVRSDGGRAPPTAPGRLRGTVLFLNAVLCCFFIFWWKSQAVFERLFPSLVPSFFFRVVNKLPVVRFVRL